MTPVEEILAALKNQGPSPTFHKYVMAKHRTEWPTLWKALDRLVKENEQK